MKARRHGRRYAHPDGEVAMGRAVGTTGSLLGVSTATAAPFAEIARTGAPWWFRVYLTRDHSVTERLVERSVANGGRALLLTLDMMAPLPASVNPRDWPESPAKSWAARSAGRSPRRGHEGAEQVIKSLTEELRHVMVQLGVAGIDELTPDLLVGRP
jgi:isopentenyl diphosphate isomerase/L-lactate dehydrogenase-like FMN-dependent dehydrogenase